MKPKIKMVDLKKKKKAGIVPKLLKKAEKKLKTKAAKDKVKTYGIPKTTAASKSIKKLNWKLKESRLKGACLKQGCSKVGCKGVFCKKHRKILRKVQLKLNNIPWRKKKAQPNYVPTQKHLAYAGKATKFVMNDVDRAKKIVKKGHNDWTTKLLDKAVEQAKAEMKQSKKKSPAAPKAKKKLAKALQKIDPTIREVKIKNHTPEVKKAKVKVAAAAAPKKAPKVMDFTND